MKEYNLGFIGAGNMAQAIINGAILKKCLSGENVYIFDIDTSKTDELKKSCGISAVKSAEQLCETCDIIVLAVKPNILKNVLGEIKDFIKGKTLVSIAAGWSAEKIKQIAGTETKVLRLMPNTPLLTGEGMTVFETPSNADPDIISFVESIFSKLGKIEHVPQKLMDAVTAVSGSGPAYVFMFIEALSDAGVLCGLGRSTATTLAAQTVLGAAKMVLETKEHPGVLKDAVCSPGGTTIEAVKSLENDGFRSAVINAAQKCAQKSKELAE